MITFYDVNTGAQLGTVSLADGALAADPAVASYLTPKWEGRAAEFMDFYKDWSNGYIRSEAAPMSRLAALYAVEQVTMAMNSHHGPDGRFATAGGSGGHHAGHVGAAPAGALRYSANPADGLPLPPEPGKVPIPDGTVRMFHQTPSEENAVAIRTAGIEARQPTEGPWGVWGAEPSYDSSGHAKGFYGRADQKPTVEYAVPKTDLDKWGGPLQRNVKPSEVLAVHLPWHAKARYIMGSPDTLKAVMSGEFDSYKESDGGDIRDTVLAIKWVKAHEAGKTHLSADVDAITLAMNRNHDARGRFARGSSGPVGTGYHQTRDLTADTAMVTAIGTKAGQSWNSKYTSGAQRALDAVYEAQGLNKALPNKVSRAEYDQLIADGGKEYHRGVGGAYPLTPTQIQNQFKHGAHYPGNGYYGNGTYMSSKKDEAKAYGTGAESSVVSMVLNKHAKIIGDKEASTRYRADGNATVESLMTLKKGSPEYDAAKKRLEAFPDPGTWAAAHGYDAMHVTAKDYMVVFNRSALTYTEEAAATKLSADVDAITLAMNPNHSPANGRFTTGGGVGTRRTELANTRIERASQPGKVWANPDNIDGAERALQAKVDQSELSIRVPKDVLDHIAADGKFKTQMDEGIRPFSKRVTYSPTERAKSAAEQFTGTSSPPVFGYLADPVNDHKSTSLTAYGQYRVILKDDVRARTTITVGDSLGGYTRPSPARHVSYESIPVEELKPTASVLAKDPAKAFTTALNQWQRKSYIEAQIHGGVKVSDIKRIELGDGEASKTRIKELLAMFPGVEMGFAGQPGPAKWIDGKVITLSEQPEGPDMTDAPVKFRFVGAQATDQLAAGTEVDHWTLAREYVRNSKGEFARVPGSRGDHARRHANKVVMHDIRQPDGGFTFNPNTGKIPSTGYLVSPYPELSKVIDVKNMTDKNVRSAITRYSHKNRDMIRKPRHFIGGWNDPATGKVYLDVSVQTKTPEEAHALSLKHDQIAYFDLQTFQSVTVNANAKSGQK